MCFFGEGALGQGVLYEEMNLAQLWKLPVIYACENNMYNEYTHFSETTAGEILARPAAFGMAAETVDGQDVRAVYAAASQARRARAPRRRPRRSCCCNTYRYHGHHVGDIARDYYRPKQEEQRVDDGARSDHAARDWLVDRRLADQAPRWTRSRGKLTAEMDAAVEFAVERAVSRSATRSTEDVYA